MVVQLVLKTSTGDTWGSDSSTLLHLGETGIGEPTLFEARQSGRTCGSNSHSLRFGDADIGESTSLEARQSPKTWLAGPTPAVSSVIKARSSMG